MTISELANSLSSGAMDGLFSQIYHKNDREKLRQRARYLNAAENFSKHFPQCNDIHILSAPARVEIGGNHTDHQHGKILASAVTSDILAIFAVNSENIIRIYSEGYGIMEINLSDLSDIAIEKGTWTALVSGIISGFSKKQRTITGFDAYITSDIPVGCGLASSAAFEVLLGKIISYCSRFNSDTVEIAKIGQYAESEFNEKNCGLMDQLLCLTGGIAAIDMKNPENPLIEKVNFDFSDSGYTLCIVDTGSSHENYSNEYDNIVSDMKSVSEILNVKHLRDADDEYFYSNIAEIRRKCSDSAVLRAMHFFAENHRAEEERICLESGCFDEFLKLVNESGDSSAMLLRNVFSVKNPEIQPVMVAVAVSRLFLKGSGAVRVHGGGFGGTILAIVPDYMVNGYINALDTVFGEGSTHIMSIRNSGAKLLY